MRTQRTSRWLSIAVALLILGSSCGLPSSSAMNAPSPRTTAETTATPSMPTSESPIAQPAPAPTVFGENLAVDLIDLARKDLTARLGVPIDRIAVVEVGDVEWRDTSLGCPEMGRIYAQVITPGKRIILAVDASTYKYHTDLSGRVVYCTSK